MMSTSLRSLIGGLGIALAGAGYFHLQAAPAGSPLQQRLRPVAAHAQAPSSGTAPASVSPERALVNKYCVTCHNQRAKTAGLALEQSDFEHVNNSAEVWEKVVKKLRAGSMPPPGMPRPDKAAYDGFASWLETELDRAAVAKPNPGRPLVHRLNRVEYTNAIRDLLALDIDGPSMLPTDESGYGFDNIADVLSFSPGLVERYLNAAAKISRLAVGDSTLSRPGVETHLVSRFAVQDERMNDDLPFGSRGGAAIRHYFPRDGEYVIRILMSRSFEGDVGIMGVEVREQVDLRLDGKRIKLFEIGGECVGSKEPRCIRPPGQAQATQYEMTADEHLFIRIPVKAGARLIGVSFVPDGTPAMEGPGSSRLPQKELALGVGLMRLGAVQIEGPFDAPPDPPDTVSRRKIFVCRPTSAANDEVCAKKILGGLARRAYRRPVTDQDLQDLLGYYRTGRAHGGFESGIEFALEGLLVAPDFLVRVERDPAPATQGSVHRLSDVELASRLSFFLWSSIPDDELLDIAASGKLSDSSILDQQVQRMLRDARATALVKNFASQWLQLRDLKSVTPDTGIFPDFDDSLREAFQHETELFIESQLREDRPVTDLLTANYTFINERLARFYGIPNVYGSHFRRVSVDDPNRTGLLGHGSILTVTSYANRTSPVQRGKFVLDNLLGAPPPPPPPNVPSLMEAGEGGAAPTTVRERMEAHRKNPVCAGCHARMDPIGFSLEQFNAIGKWRTEEFGAPIDSTGVMADGTKFQGPSGLRNVLLSHRQEYIYALGEKLLTYALGRGTEYYDGPAVRKIVRDAAASEFRWSSLILGVINSTPFRMRLAVGAPVPATARQVSSDKETPR